MHNSRRWRVEKSIHAAETHGEEERCLDSSKRQRECHQNLLLLGRPPSEDFCKKALALLFRDAGKRVLVTGVEDPAGSQRREASQENGRAYQGDAAQRLRSLRHRRKSTLATSLGEIVIESLLNLGRP